MLSLPSALHIFLAVEPADMRKGFDGLAQLVRERIAEDPLSGHLYVFRNRRRDRVKLLYWDRDGFALWSKRLEEGTYAIPVAESPDERRREMQQVPYTRDDATLRNIAAAASPVQLAIV